jgi:glycogen phosphorylase
LGAVSTLRMPFGMRVSDDDDRFVNTIRQGDFYLISDDFDSYLQAQKMVDDAYQKDPQEWIKKSIRTSARMGKFSSDRAIMTYAEEIWNIEPVKID